MIEKRFRYVDATDEVDEHIIDYGTEPHFEYYTLKGATDKLNELAEENKDNKAMIEFLNIENNQIMNELKTRTQIQHQLEEENEQLKAQLYCDSNEGVCSICKHHYLEKTNMFYISKCEKGHEKCSKESVRHCEDFKLKELQE